LFRCQVFRVLAGFCFRGFAGFYFRGFTGFLEAFVHRVGCLFNP
jgi:hypothetical protein